MSLWSLDEHEIWFPYRNEMDGDRVAIGGDLSWKRVVKGFQRACYPFYTTGQDIAWWSPENRAVFLLNDLQEGKCSQLRHHHDDWSFQWDGNFETILRGCQRSEHEENAWLHAEVMNLYRELFFQGFAHSLEVKENGKIIGGVFGVSLGRVFFGLSMYHLVPGASKAALCYVMQFLAEKKWKVFDAQRMTPFLKQMGAIEIEREYFLDILSEEMQYGTARGNWSETAVWRSLDAFPMTEEFPNEWI
jgi:leucyl/phenylalanyl-tRNA--protein transferase